MTDIVSETELRIKNLKTNSNFDPINNKIVFDWSKREDNNIKKIEVNLINQYNKYSMCSPELKSLISSSLQNMNTQNISELVKTQFYNTSVMEEMTCLVMSLLDDELGYIEMLNKSEVLKLVDKDHMIIFFSNFFQGKYKVLTFKFDEDEIIHEGFIGLNFINKVRKILPTYAWTYGFTSCNLPIFTKKNGKDLILTACTKKVNQANNDYIGLITEYVKGETLKKYIFSQELDERRLVSTLLTILYSLKYANDMFSYVHWDLHTNNILMRELDTDDNYIYLPNENKYLWVGNKLATIIDYGFNSVMYNNQLFANVVRPDVGINPYITKSSLNDVLKLFSHIYDNSLDYYNLDKTDIKRKNVLKFFNSKIYNTLLNAKDSTQLVDFNNIILTNYATYPNQRISSDLSKDITIDKFSKIDFIKLIEILESLFPDLILTQTPKNVLSCNVGRCLSSEQILEETFSGLTSETSIKQLLPELLSDRENSKIIIEILRKYLDEIFDITQKYENTPTYETLDLIFIFNELRVAEQKLEKILKVSKKLVLKDIYNQAYYQRNVIKDLIMKLASPAKISISKYKPYLKLNLKAPKVQIEKEINHLINSFENIVTNVGINIPEPFEESM
jgi:hypothetical protein